MEGDQKRPKETKRLEGEKTNSRPIQEYEFFVHGGAGETEAMPLENQKAGGVKEKNGGQSKSRIFFSSIEEADT